MSDPLTQRIFPPVTEYVFTISAIVDRHGRGSIIATRRINDPDGNDFRQAEVDQELVVDLDAGFAEQLHQIAERVTSIM